MNHNPLIPQIVNMYQAMGFTQLPDIADLAATPSGPERADLEARCVLVGVYDALVRTTLTGDAAKAAIALEGQVTVQALACSRRHAMLCSFVHLLSEQLRMQVREAGAQMNHVSIDRQPVVPLSLLPALRTAGAGRAFQQALDRLYVTAAVARANRGQPDINTTDLVFMALDGAAELFRGE